jgi:hypothetical protein
MLGPDELKRSARAVTPMRTILAVLLLVTSVVAADRQWQSGTCISVDTRRKSVDFGPGVSPFGGPPAAPSLPALADVRTFVITTENLRLEVEDVVPVGRRSIELTTGQEVTFALEKNSIYIKDEDGKEYRLRVTKKTTTKSP